MFIVLMDLSRLVLNGGNANQFIVLATHDNSPALVLVEADAEGLSIQSFKTLDGQTCGINI